MKILLSLREAANRLGFSYITLWKWQKQGKIPAIRIGGRLRLDEKEIEKFIKGNRVKKPKKYPS
ncbi:MAG: helix-turn-helix domain-containing protein [Acidobacteriota bacterium]